MNKLLLIASLLLCSCQTLPGLYNTATIPMHFSELETRGISFIQLTIRSLPRSLLATVFGTENVALVRKNIREVLILHPEIFLNSLGWGETSKVSNDITLTNRQVMVANTTLRMATQGGTGNVIQSPSILIQHSLLVSPQQIASLPALEKLFRGEIGFHVIAPGMLLIFDTVLESPLALINEIFIARATTSPVQFESDELFSLVNKETVLMAAFFGDDANLWSNMGNDLFSPRSLRTDGQRSAFIEEKRDLTAISPFNSGLIEQSILALHLREESSTAFSADLVSSDTNKAKALVVAVRVALRRKLEQMFPGLSAEEYRQAIEVEAEGRRVTIRNVPVSTKSLQELLMFMSPIEVGRP